MYKTTLLALAIFCSIGSAEAATVIASNTVATLTSSANAYVGQSFTVNGADGYTDIVFSFQNRAGDNVGAGKLYLYDSQYTGDFTGLADTKALAVASFANGSYNFASTLTLAGNKVYYAYSDSAFSVGMSLTTANAYAGGAMYQANTTITKFVETLRDARFSVSGTRVPAVAAVPEPAGWATMIAGFGVVGATMRRRRRRGSLRFA